MHAGFSMLEAGCVRAKNTINILFKNIVTVCIGAFAYFVVGSAVGSFLAALQQYVFDADPTRVAAFHGPNFARVFVWFSRARRTAH